LSADIGKKKNSGDGQRSLANIEQVADLPLRGVSGQVEYIDLNHR